MSIRSQREFAAPSTIITPLHTSKVTRDFQGTEEVRGKSRARLYPQILLGECGAS